VDKINFYARTIVPMRFVQLEGGRGSELASFLPKCKQNEGL